VGYQVINEFIEKEHENVLYKQGEVYPKDGFQADPERVSFLQTSNNRYKKAFLGHELIEEEDTDGKVSEVDSEQFNEVDNTKSTEPEQPSKKGSTKKKTSTKK
jgi:hypothetical protein